jgi:hypothetical protein
MNFLTSTTPATFPEASPYRARPSVRHPSSAEEGSFARKATLFQKPHLPKQGIFHFRAAIPKLEQIGVSAGPNRSITL